MNSFEEERKGYIELLSNNARLREDSLNWLARVSAHKYSYNFSWLGRPIIQFPQDIVVLQELVWQIKPQLIIETGIAHGGSLIFYASMLELVGGEGMVLGIDIDIRQHNRIEIEAHPMMKRIQMIEGSSTDADIISKVYEFASGRSPVMVVLDSMHTHAHVLSELNAYSPLVTKNSCLVVMDTVIEDMPEDSFPDRPWGRGQQSEDGGKRVSEEQRPF